MKTLLILLTVSMAYGAAITPLAWREAHRRIVDFAAANPAVVEAVARSEEDARLAHNAKQAQWLEAAVPASALTPPALPPSRKH